MQARRVRVATARPFHRCPKAMFQGCELDTYDMELPCPRLYSRGLRIPATIMILHGLWCSNGSESQRPDAQDAPPLACHCRVILAMLLLSSWFAVEMWSDLAHLTGATPQLSRHDPGWPISELAMFVHPSGPSFDARSLSLEILGMRGLCVKKSRDA